MEFRRKKKINIGLTNDIKLIIYHFFYKPKLYKPLFVFNLIPIYLIFFYSDNLYMIHFSKHVYWYCISKKKIALQIKRENLSINNRKELHACIILYRQEFLSFSSYLFFRFFFSLQYNIYLLCLWCLPWKWNINFIISNNLH